MKRVLCLFLFVITLQGFSQQYPLFHANSKKLFNTPLVWDSSYSIRFDSVRWEGADSVYYNHTGLDHNSITSDSCMFWGGPQCQQQNVSWIGTRIEKKTSGLYTFYNRQQEALQFDFALPTGDSAIVYQDFWQIFRIISEGKDTATILGYQDSVMIFRISHRYLNGNPINSVLHQQHIRIGKTLGLTDFIRIDQFPGMLQMMTLRGNTNPDAGLVRMTNEFLYNHQPGDEIQFFESFSGSAGQPPFQKYTKQLFLSRIDTPDSLIYTVQVSVFEPGNPQQNMDTVRLAYYRYTVYAEIPFDYIDQTTPFVERKIAHRNYCGIPLWTYRIRPNPMMYCVTDNCWGTMDTGGPPPIEETIFVEGLGLYTHVYGIFGPPPMGFTSFFGIHYFKKNGIICGNEAILNIDEAADQSAAVSIYPNPVTDFLQIETKEPGTTQIWFTTLTGQELGTQTLHQPITAVDLREFAKGVYFLQITNSNRTYSVKVIKN
jgi:hypothetical protein